MWWTVAKSTLGVDLGEIECRELVTEVMELLRGQHGHVENPGISDRRKTLPPLCQRDKEGRMV